MDAFYHSVSSAKMFGGQPEDYYPVHAWFDRSKGSFADFRHRALSHHAEGIQEAINRFGPYIMNSQGVKVPVRRIGEQHVAEDLGRIPSLRDWFSHIRPERWMSPPSHLLFRDEKLDQLLAEHKGRENFRVIIN